MALDKSILNSTKKILGLGEGYGSFDLDIITHINTCFFTLKQLGIGPERGFSIEDEVPVWSDFIDDEEYESELHAAKTYVYLRVRLLFDPPGTPYHITAIEEQIAELTHRLLMERNLRMGPPAVPSLLP